MKLAGMTTNPGSFGSENLLGRIGSPTLRPPRARPSNGRYSTSATLNSIAMTPAGEVCRCGINPAARRQTVTAPGDNAGTARSVAESLPGLDEYRAELLPQDKVHAVRDMSRTLPTTAAALACARVASTPSRAGRVTRRTRRAGGG